MNIVARGSGRHECRYPLRVQFYDSPPDEELRIEEFEQFALDRLQLLKMLESAKIRNFRDVQLENYLRKAENEHVPLGRSNENSAETDAQRRKDHVSHFILRLAYCRTEDLRRWLLNQECALFRYRYENLSLKEKEEFIQSHDLGFEPVSPVEKKQYYEELKTIAARIANGIEKDFYKVDFERALELVAHRKVFLRGGCAYVPGADLVSLLVGEFRARLSRALVATAKALPRMEEDERLLPILTNMSRHYVGPDYANRAANGQITADTVPDAVQHFPLCMQHLHRKLMDESHLRYGGRMQYGLFLKGIGLSMEEALLFWRRAFSRKTPDDKFQKEYAYNIRHNYGQEGKRANYTPYSCVKIITSNQPSTGDHHGCPFRHFNEDNLRAVLRSNGTADRAVQEILELVKNQHYQIACTKYFEITRKVDDSNLDVIAHPNQYYERSTSLGKARDEPKKE